MCARFCSVEKGKLCNVPLKFDMVRFRPYTLPLLHETPDQLQGDVVVLVLFGRSCQVDSIELFVFWRVVFQLSKEIVAS